MAKDFPHPIPAGWFALLRSEALAPGALTPLRAFDRELVAWRDAGGHARVFPAHCPHLGAHLGYAPAGDGGRVEGETIRCPFHGWRFDGEGRCVEVPYARRSMPRDGPDTARRTTARIEPWPVAERNGFLWTWYASDGRAPFYAIPELDEWQDPGWHEVHAREWVIRTQIQEMAENGVDGAHFQTVHGAAGLPASEIEVDGPTRVAIQRAPLQTKRGASTSVITVRQVGLGLSYTRFTGIATTTSLNLVLPLDAETTRLTVVFRQPIEAPDARATRAIIADLEKQIGEDIPIWEHKRYLARPALCDGDGPIAELRRWCAQFYPEAAA